MSIITHAIGRALYMVFAMFWEILWPLILGFSLSAVVQVVVSKSEIVRLLPDDRAKTLWRACGLGAASSSCSYAAVAITRSMFKKGANFTAAMAFELTSTNMVAELAIILIVLMGWQFAVAEFAGAPLMVFILAFLFRRLLSPQLLRSAKEQANKGVKGVMEGHAEMDMSVTGGPLLKRILSDKGRTAISHYFVMDRVSIWKDIAGGLLIAGSLAAWVPQTFWRAFYLTSHPLFAKFWGAHCRPADCDCFLRMLGRKYPACSGFVERRQQFRRCDRVPVCRLDRLSDSQHLSEILRRENDRLSAGDNVSVDGPRSACN